MSQKKRILFGVAVIGLLIMFVLGIEAIRRATATAQLAGGDPAGVEVTLQPGNIPIYVNGQLVAGFSPDALSELTKVSFVEPVEGKTEEGWLLRDVLNLYLPPEKLKSGTLITVSSSSREKSVQLTWDEVDNAGNMVMFDLANRGTLKLASKLEKLDTREEWIQDVDKIEVQTP